MQTICGHTREQFLEMARRFHGYPAPGLIAGGFMVDLALSRLPPGILFDAIAESPACLPDAIQMLTPCTAGNGWLKIVDTGRFAICLYDKRSGDGFRVFVEPSRLEPWTEMRCWLMKLKPKAEQDTPALVDQIFDAGRRPYGVRAVRLPAELRRKQSKGPIAVCRVCGEPYPQRHGATCRGCQCSTIYEGPASHQRRNAHGLCLEPRESAIQGGTR
ncbi:MAG: formylmethanofuran dehydrogenase subunit E family protein [Proteobacteria bacterium]|nr:formylmethanofuran dehydrogenase subunit E family protein [Pseudomonadota bacterium]